MSCCDKGSATAAASWTPIPDFTQPTFMLPGESVDCYMNRAGNPSGDQRGAPEEVPGKITTNTIAVDCNMNVVTATFLVSASTATSTVTSWGFTITPPVTASTSTTAALVFNSSTGILSGTFPAADEKKKFTILITAYSGTATLDSRSYTVVPKICRDDEDVKLQHPMPGSRNTSRFGPRQSPCAGCSSTHGGLDFSYGQGNYGSGKPVLCSADGTVEFNGVQRGYGNIVIVKHQNAKGQLVCRTAYAHLGKVLVAQGHKISAGTPVGFLGGPYGWTGIGTGIHLHYEVRLPGLPGKGCTDPLPYLDGTYTTSLAAITATGESDPGTPTGPDSYFTNTNVQMTYERGNAQPCPVFNAPPVVPTLSDTATNFIPSQQIGPSRASCRPATTPSAATVKSEIDAVLNMYPDLDASDRLFVHITAQIESNYDPYAKNKTSSATGLYQFLDQLAKVFYGGGKFQAPALAGIPPTCENRCNVTYATHAMVAWYKKEILPGYNSYVASGGTRILGKVIAPNSVSAKYASYTKAEWCYAFHHAGLPAMIAGTDTQGAQYIQRRKTDFA